MIVCLKNCKRHYHKRLLDNRELKKTCGIKIIEKYAKNNFNFT